jgi:hypothetical protein
MCVSDELDPDPALGPALDPALDPDRAWARVPESGSRDDSVRYTLMSLISVDIP